MLFPLEKKSFLIVDDFGDMRSMLRSMLSMFGVTRIDMAANGKDAVAALKRNRYDVILCDYNLGPGKDGQQVLEEARHCRLISLSTVFVMITAENTREMVMGAIEYEPDSYLSKPFTKDLLRNRLEKLLVKKQDLEPVDQALERNDYPLAIQLLDRRIAAKPKNLADLTRLKADLCLRSGAYNAAAAVYERVLAIREIPWARLGMGKVLFAKKQYSEALAIFQELIQEHGNLSAAYDWLARTHKAMGDLGSAQEVLASAVKLSPKAILRQQALGDLAMRNHDFKTAEKAFNRTVTIGRHSVFKHPSHYAKLAESKVSNDENKDREKAAALGVIQQMEKEFGKAPEAELYAAMSEAVVQQGLGNEAAARSSLERADTLYQRMATGADSGLSLAMAKTAARLGETEKAEALFRKVVRNNHENDELLQDVAAAYAETGLSDSPDELIAEIKKEIVELNNRGVKLAGEGHIDEAIGLFEEAAEGMAGNKTINLNAAKVLIMHMEKKGVEADALTRTRKYLERARKLAPDDVGLAKVMAKFKQLVVDSSL